MKRYLLVGIALLFVNANASLKEDFDRMDQEQEELLNAMRDSASLTGDEDEDDEEGLEETETSKVAVKTEKVSEEDDDLDLDLDENPEETPTKEKSTPQRSSAETLEVIKKAMVLIDESFEKGKVVREKEAIAQREAEKREVEAYEKQRAKKLAQAAKEAKIAELAQKIKLEKKKLVAKAVHTKPMKKPLGKEMEHRVASLHKEAMNMNMMEDVNVTRELLERKKAADLEYENAIMEMAEED